MRRRDFIALIGGGVVLSPSAVAQDQRLGFVGSAPTANDPLVRINSIVVGRLSDGRLQLFAEKDGELWSTWKQTTDPNAPWTGWSPFLPGNRGLFERATCGAAAALPNGALQFFALASSHQPVSASIGTGVVTTWKLSSDVEAGWADWDVFYRGTHGPGKSEDARIFAIAAALRESGLLQVVMLESRAAASGPASVRLMTRSKLTSRPDSPWIDPQPLNPQPPEEVNGLALSALPDNGLHLWGCGEGTIWSTKWSGDANSAWEAWSRFQAAPGPAYALAVGPLPNGGLQLWAMVDGGTTYTCWTSTSDPDGPWTPWVKFFGTELKSLSVAPLTDGRLQLWGLDKSGTLFSTSKLTADDNSGWAPWSVFPGP
jgi:hypothetical protein